MMRIYLEEILEYYDGILLFIGKDIFGSKYLCSLYEDESSQEEFYLAIRISKSRISELIDHQMDLKSALLNPEYSGEYFKLDWDGSEYYTCTRFGDEFVPTENMLPETGYFCDSNSMTNELSNVLSDLRRPVFTIGVNDKYGSHSVDTNVAGEILQTITSMYNAVKKQYGAEIEVVSTQAASFNFVLATKEDINLFSNIPTDTKMSFERMAHLLSLLSSRDLSREEVQPKEYNSLVKLAKVYANNNLSLKFSYITSPDDRFSNKSYISSSDIIDFYSMTENKNESIADPPLSAIGCFQKCDNKNGTWTFVLEDGSEIKGKSEKDSFSGVVISDKKYLITYQVAQERDGLGNVTKNNRLIRFEPTEQADKLT